MAIYTRSNVATAGGLQWDDVAQWQVVSTDSTLVLLQNSDGTFTEIEGTGFTFSGSTATAGTVTAVRRLDGDAATLLENTTGLSLTLVALQAAWTDPAGPAPVLLANDDTLTGGSLDDVISGFAGNDTLIGEVGADALDGGAGTGDTAS